MKDQQLITYELNALYEYNYIEVNLNILSENFFSDFK